VVKIPEASWSAGRNMMRKTVAEGVRATFRWSFPLTAAKSAIWGQVSVAFVVDLLGVERRRGYSFDFSTVFDVEMKEDTDIYVRRTRYGRGEGLPRTLSVGAM